MLRSTVEQREQDGGQEQVLVTVRPGGRTENGALGKDLWKCKSVFYFC